MCVLGVHGVCVCYTRHAELTGVIGVSVCVCVLGVHGVCVCGTRHAVLTGVTGVCCVHGVCVCGNRHAVSLQACCTDMGNYLLCVCTQCWTCCCSRLTCRQWTRGQWR